MSAHVASVVGIARAGSNKGQIGGAGALHAPERFERYIQEGLAWVPFYNGDTVIRGQRTQVRRRPLGRQGSQRWPIRASEPSSTGRIAGHQRFMNAHEDNRLLPVETDRVPRAAGASLLGASRHNARMAARERQTKPASNTLLGRTHSNRRSQAGAWVGGPHCRPRRRRRTPVRCPLWRASSRPRSAATPILARTYQPRPTESRYTS